MDIEIIRFIVMKYVAPVLIGIVIGAITNKIALVMLFRPYDIKKFGKIKIPFTPGLIPKNRKRIATAIAKNISLELLTTQGIVKELKQNKLDEKIENKIIMTIYDENKKVSDIAGAVGIKKESFVPKVSSTISNIILQEINNLDINSIMKKIVTAAVENMPFIGMFISGKIDNISLQLSQLASKYLEAEGKEFVENAVLKKVNNIYDSEISSVLDKFNVTKQDVQGAVRKVTETLIKKIELIKIDIHIQKIVEDQINQMSMREIENIINDIAKKELKSLVFVGGVLGGFIGALNILINNYIR